MVTAPFNDADVTVRNTIRRFFSSCSDEYDARSNRKFQGRSDDGRRSLSWQGAQLFVSLKPAVGTLKPSVFPAAGGCNAIVVRRFILAPHRRDDPGP